MSKNREIALGSLRLGGGNPLFLIAGPCVIESEAHARTMAEKVAKIAADAGVPYIFKASYDKANRSSLKAFRVLGAPNGSPDRRRQDRPHHQCEEAAVSFALGHGQRDGKSGEHREYKNYSHGTRRFVRLPESRRRYAFVPDHAKNRLPGR